MRKLPKSSSENKFCDLVFVVFEGFFPSRRRRRICVTFQPLDMSALLLLGRSEADLGIRISLEAQRDGAPASRLAPHTPPEPRTRPSPSPAPSPSKTPARADSHAATARTSVEFWPGAPCVYVCVYMCVHISLVCASRLCETFAFQPTLTLARAVFGRRVTSGGHVAGGGPSGESLLLDPAKKN